MLIPIVISCFDLTITFVQPWADASYLCYCVDLQHPPGETCEGNIIRVGDDVREWLPSVLVALALVISPHLLLSHD